MLMLDTSKPFTTKQAVKAGISKRMLASVAFQQIYHGCYISARVDVDLALRVKTATSTLKSGEFATHHTAAELWGGVVPHTSVVHVGVVGTTQRTRREGLRLHRYTTLPLLASVRGTRVTSPEQTFVDLATVLDLVDLVILGDSLIHRRRTTVDRLVRASGQFSGRNAATARRAAALVRAGAESPNETRVRLLMQFAGLPEPVLNRRIVDRRGRQRRIDLTFPEFRVAIEFDGKHHLTGGENQWRADNCRREDLEADGWRFVVLTSTDIYAAPAGTLERIVDAMRLQGMPVPQICPAWGRYFRG